MAFADLLLGVEVSVPIRAVYEACTADLVV